ncbi:putative transmembrane protein [Ophiocordyceps camponoti-floridani]|uniref:Putative transmembrane protein n=1 Tax=Ophiocordyceps camponoti-floridani TaxID=2030778 RepID=A0A8H4QC25_9HYPO|nr:putative transmembrane protein [Ophiocordyceps camponoti-floridani]
MSWFRALGRVGKSFGSLRRWAGRGLRRALAWTYQLVVVVILVVGLSAALGFGSSGVVAGSMAAAFQSAVYGGFTPAAGVFAALTSMGMTGTLLPTVAVVTAVLSGMAAYAYWNLSEWMTGPSWFRG